MAALTAAVAKIRLFFDPTREPLRRRVYSTLVALLAVCGAAGYITGNDVAAVTSIAAVALMVPATESARRLVTPVAAPDLDDPGKHAADRGDAA